MTHPIPALNIDEPQKQPNNGAAIESSMIEPAIVDATQHNPAIRLAKGFYQKWRRMINAPLILLFLLAPWLQLNDVPLLHMDLANRQLHVLGLNFWPDDLMVLLWLAMASAFALFTVANFAGRLWCGFACPQTIWSMLFTWVEEKTQGPRHQRLKQLQQPFYERPLLPLLLKHLIWLSISLLTGFTFVAFFETGQGLWHSLVQGSISLEVLFWLGFFSVLTYVNAGWLREQVCLHMCPYARFQSVMLDPKSLKVSYQASRGEPRLNKQSKSEHNKQTSGDCIDCTLCVQVCPVGIDIRQGMQYACIDCGACIDACDHIMRQTQRPLGLIKFSNGTSQPWRALFSKRPRLLGYSLMTILSLSGLWLYINAMESFDSHLMRDRGQLYFYDGQGHINNAYRLKLHNKSTEQKIFTLSVQPKALTLSRQTLVLQGGHKTTFNLLLSCTSPCTLARRNQVSLNIQSNNDTSETKVIESVFFNPE